MKYLKKFNEDKSFGDLSFESFCEIMRDITDDFEHECVDMSEDDYYYDCKITLPVIDDYAIDDDCPIPNLDFLKDDRGGLPGYEDPENIANSFGKLYEYVEHQNNDLLKLKNDLDQVIENNNKIVKIFKTFEESILPRFQLFDNFKESDVGFDVFNNLLRITFEIVD